MLRTSVLSTLRSIRTKAYEVYDRDKRRGSAFVDAFGKHHQITRGETNSGSIDLYIISEGTHLDFNLILKKVRKQDLLNKLLRDSDTVFARDLFIVEELGYIKNTNIQVGQGDEDMTVRISFDYQIAEGYDSLEVYRDHKEHEVYDLTLAGLHSAKWQVDRFRKLDIRVKVFLSVVLDTVFEGYIFQETKEHDVIISKDWVKIDGIVYTYGT